MYPLGNLERKQFNCCGPWLWLWTSDLVNDLTESHKTKSRAEAEQTASVGHKLDTRNLLVPQYSRHEGILKLTVSTRLKTNLTDLDVDVEDDQVLPGVPEEDVLQERLRPGVEAGLVVREDLTCGAAPPVVLTDVSTEAGVGPGQCEPPGVRAHHPNLHQQQALLLSLPEVCLVGESRAGELRVEDLVLAGRLTQPGLAPPPEDLVHAEEGGLLADGELEGGGEVCVGHTVAPLYHSLHCGAVQTVGQAVPVPSQVFQLQLAVKVAASLLWAEP